MFAHLTDALTQGDLLFGQLETNVTEGGARAPHAKLAMRTPLDNGKAIQRAGFGVMSFAGNHCLDWGEEGFRDTLHAMTELDIPVCGAGPDISAARRPVIVACGDLKLAFLAYSSILPEGYAATQSRPGCAPLRAHTTYEMIEPDQPGTKPRILTSPHRQDLADMVQDIEAAKRVANLVLVSVHWGIHITPVEIADYQYDIAHAAIDAGASAVLGHHPHILKAVEFYKGCPIFYSMGNFAIEQPQVFDPDITKAPSFKHLISLHPDKPPEGLYVLPEDTRMTMIVELSLNESGVTETRIRPCWIEDDSAPHLLSPDDPKFSRIASYLREITHKLGLLLHTERVGDRLVLSETR
tara:strand:- start:465 stop:1523 length:1059 start_codon:yes stop_codon:yes gene_type:complete